MRKLLPITIIIFLAVVIVSIISTSTVVSNPFPYKIPVIPNKQSYLTFLVGDSMVAALGANDDGLRQNLIKYYPGHEFVNYNYGFPSTNIESLPDRLEKGVTFDGKDYQSILSQGFDLIILESFAYNPLSQYPLE
ncbi:MAG TPA: hypothetical protein VKC54_02495, partial [Patescibacteria group bacterium]|nr:hypothetical protein [Patescibacteria group bacterium]